MGEGAIMCKFYRLTLPIYKMCVASDMRFCPRMQIDGMTHQMGVVNHYLDMVALTMLHTDGINKESVKGNILRAKCKLGRWKEEAKRALEQSVTGLTWEC
jgi:hypothetical protein